MGGLRRVSPWSLRAACAHTVRKQEHRETGLSLRRMSVTFAIIATLTVASAVAVMTLRNLVHCALSLMLTFVGLAALFLQLNAQFVGFAQILVYVGAVAILIVFAILLTGGSEPPKQPIFSATWSIGGA